MIIQGQSISTEEKERGFTSFFTQQMRVWSAIHSRIGRFNYFHFDLHAGSGFNEEVGVVGSPLLFIDAAEKAGVKSYVFHAIDIDPSTGIRLAAATAHDARTFVHIGDNAELLRCIPDIIRHYGENLNHAIGSILIDPNNQSRLSIPWRELSVVATLCPKIDIAFNYPGTAMKRVREACGGNHEDIVNVETLPRLFHKKHMWIRYPVGNHQFTLIVGRNFPFGDHRAIGLYSWDSREGIQCRRKVSLTKEQLRNAIKSQQLTFDGVLSNL